MAGDDTGAAMGKPQPVSSEPQPTLYCREKRAAAKFGALALVGLFSLAVAFALFAALFVEGK
jgi:hypothetical protein